MGHPQSPAEVASWADRFASKVGSPLTLLPTERGRLALRASDSGLELRWPVRASAELVEHFLERQQTWIDRQRERYASIASAIVDAFRWQREDGVLLLFGKRLPIHFGGVRGACEIQSDRLLLGFDNTGEAARRALAATTISRLQRDLHAYARELAVSTGLKPRSMTLKPMRSLWGSCSFDGRIRINSALVCVPARVSRYVLAHEAAHIEHRDHSARFWSRVAQIVPDYAAQRQVLRDEHAVVLRLGEWLFAPPSQA
jgi:hypothetical protein